MSINKLREEIAFGLENLEKIYSNIVKFAQEDIRQEIVIAALTYECFGYYNAIEHLMIRCLKYLRVSVPSGQFSHRDTLKSFYNTMQNNALEIEPNISMVIENLMAFRHVATKIYSFLVDWDKLMAIIDDITTEHENIKQLFATVLATVNS